MTNSMAGLQTTGSVAFTALTTLDYFVSAYTADQLDMQVMTNTHIANVLNVRTRFFYNSLSLEGTPASAVWTHAGQYTAKTCRDALLPYNSVQRCAKTKNQSLEGNKSGVSHMLAHNIEQNKQMSGKPT